MVSLTFSSASSPISLLRMYTSLAVLLLGAIALIVPSGYSVGAVLLLLGTFVLPFIRTSVRFGRQDWWVIGVLAFYALVGLFEAWRDGQGLRGVDKPLRFLLVIPVLALILAHPPRLSFLWGGLALGGIAVGSWGLGKSCFPVWIGLADIPMLSSLATSAC